MISQQVTHDRCSERCVVNYFLNVKNFRLFSPSKLNEKFS